MFCNKDVRKNSLTFPQTDILKSSCNPKFCNFIRCRFYAFFEFSDICSGIKLFHFSVRIILCNIFTVKPYSSVCRRVNPGYNIESRRFSSTVRADKRNNFAFINFKRKIIYRNYATKLHGDIFHFQYIFFHLCHPYLAAFFLRLLKNCLIPAMLNSLSLMIPF